MKNSAISWCDNTFNPWIGCTKVSPGCAHCYAETLTKRFWSGTHWGKGQPRLRTSIGNWEQPLAWNRKAERDRVDALHSTPAGQPCALARPRVFCASLADWLDDEVPIEWLADLLKLIHDTPNLDWLLLTKRPENWKKRVWAVGERWAMRGRGPSEDSGSILQWLAGIPPANVWLGVSVEDKPRLSRIDQLCAIPARVRFLSVEPLLEEITLPEDKLAFVGEGHENFGINWVIVGGESGPGARQMNLTWACSIRDQCKRTGVPFFFKQLGSNCMIDIVELDALQPEPAIVDSQHPTPVDRVIRADDPSCHFRHFTGPGKGGDLDQIPPGLRIREFPRP